MAPEEVIGFMTLELAKLRKLASKAVEESARIEPYSSDWIENQKLVQDLNDLVCKLEQQFAVYVQRHGGSDDEFE